MPYFYSHFMQFYYEFLWWAIKATNINMLQLYSSHFYMVLINLKWWFNYFRLHQVFPILMVQMLSHPPPKLYDFREVGKSLGILHYCTIKKRQNLTEGTGLPLNIHFKIHRLFPDFQPFSRPFRGQRIHPSASNYE